MKCPRGWILCQNDEGFTVPYFVKVALQTSVYPVLFLRSLDMQKSYRQI